MKIKIDKDFEYVEEGKGKPIILLHGLMGGLDNFEHIIHKIQNINFKVIIPVLPIFKNSIAKTNIKPLLIKELSVGILNGIFWSAIVAIIVIVWFGQFSLGIIIGASMIIAFIVIAVFVILCLNLKICYF